jgi:N-acetylmuramoyl-L-alanine amidase
MKYAIDIGHNSPPDIGAVNGYEDKLNKELGNLIAVGLTSLGYEVIIANPKGKCYSVGHSLKLRCQIANNAIVDRFVSIHHNAYNGQAHGTEVFYLSSAGKAMAVPVLEEICKLNIDGHQFRKRGAKRTTKLQVLNLTDAPAILIEAFFCDSPADIQIYKAIGVKRIAAAIVKGLTGKDPNVNDQPCLYIE